MKEVHQESENAGKSDPWSATSCFESLWIANKIPAQSIETNPGSTTGTDHGGGAIPSKTGKLRKNPEF